MNDSDLSSAVVSHVLQVTRQSWTQTLAIPAVVHAPSSHKLSSHRLALQRTARNKRPPWGLQVASVTVHALEG